MITSSRRCLCRSYTGGLTLQRAGIVHALSMDDLSKQFYHELGVREFVQLCIAKVLGETTQLWRMTP